MLKKVFLQTQFGSPHPWTAQYFDNVVQLARSGWEMIVFTPNKTPEYCSSLVEGLPWTQNRNIRRVEMTLERFNTLLEEKTGAAIDNKIVEGRPQKLVSDYYPAYGQIFEDYIQTADYWGFTNWDMVYGRLSHFIPDEELVKWDIWSDDANTINGIFTLMKNTESVNNLFRAVPEWQQKFEDFAPQAFDEHHFTEAVRRYSADNFVRFGYPKYGGLHSYDRLAQHQPKPRLRMADDGALIEIFNDVKGSSVQYYNQEQAPGHEIMSFHFSHTKAWPL